MSSDRPTIPPKRDRLTNHQNAIAKSLTKKHDHPIILKKHDRPINHKNAIAQASSKNTIAQPLTPKTRSPNLSP